MVYQGVRGEEAVELRIKNALDACGFAGVCRGVRDAQGSVAAPFCGGGRFSEAGFGVAADKYDVVDAQVGEDKGEIGGVKGILGGFGQDVLLLLYAESARGS